MIELTDYLKSGSKVVVTWSGGLDTTILYDGIRDERVSHDLTLEAIRIQVNDLLRSLPSISVAVPRVESASKSDAGSFTRELDRGDILQISLFTLSLAVIAYFEALRIGGFTTAWVVFVIVTGIAVVWTSKQLDRIKEREKRLEERETYLH